MPVVSLTDVTIRFSGPPVLESVSLHIEKGERVCVLGRNGSGKSTLLKAINGDHGLNSGSVSFPNGGFAATLQQDIPSDTAGAVFDVIASGFGETGSMLRSVREGESVDSLDTELQWKMEQRIADELELDLQSEFESLSGGMKRRVLLGKAIVGEPAILALDEPTNHMDIESIQWLEEFLKKGDMALIFVTHDRSFIRALSTRIVEVDLAALRSFNCDYDTYLIRKAELLEAEARNQSAFDKKLSKEEAWLRQGIKARRTRNEGRVRALKQLRAERADRRTRQGKASLNLSNAEQSGRKVISAEGVNVRLGDFEALKPFSLEIMRGDRIGIVGPNGSGKSTLIKVLLGQIAPFSGTIEHGTKLEIAYFDQLREQLDDETTLFENIGDGNESLSINGRSRHVISYLQDFLFTPEQARASIKTLSGGERNRLLLAKLFTKPANLIVLDEPTNDLDMETLELLEERVTEFPGTLILVSHDRAFLENTVTNLVIIQKGGIAREFNGGYDDWLNESKPLDSGRSPKKKSTRSNWKIRPRKFTKSEQAELDSIPSEIERIDARKAEIADKLASPQTYKENPGYAESAKVELANLENESERIFARWEELETLKESL